MEKLEPFYVVGGSVKTCRLLSKTTYQFSTKLNVELACSQYCTAGNMLNGKVYHYAEAGTQMPCSVSHNHQTRKQSGYQSTEELKDEEWYVHKNGGLVLRKSEVLTQATA